MRLIKLTARHLRVSRLYSKDVSVKSGKSEVEKVENIPQFLSNAQILEKKEIPIEKKSVSRGLMLNRFERDFMIYPELLDKKAVDDIKNYCDHLKYRLDVALGTGDPVSAVNQVLMENFVFAAYISKEFGGMGMKRRELLCISETIANLDMSTFLNVSSVQMATMVIQNFGSKEQIERLIPKIGTGQIRVAISLEDVTESLNLEATRSNGKIILNGKLENFLNASDADVLVVFAKEAIKDGQETMNCYVVDKDNIKGKVKTERPKQVMGLENVKFSTVHFRNVELTPADELNQHLSGPQIFTHLQEINRSFAASAAVGALKRVISDLAYQANRTIVGRNKALSEMPSVKTVINKMARDVHHIETVVFYFNGLSDEDLFVINDVESMVVEKLTRRALQNAILGISEVIGMAAVDAYFTHERWIRDLATFFCTLTTEPTLNEKISEIIVKTLKDENPRWRSSWIRWMMPAPKPTSTSAMPVQAAKHFIAEHVHISLKPPAINFEAGLGHVDETLYKTLGKNAWKIPEDKTEPVKRIIADMTTEQILLAAMLSRTSRSYSIGLKNCDMELQWTIDYGREFEKNIAKAVRDMWHVWNMKEYKKPILSMGYPFQMPLAAESADTIGQD
ncbi:unnamed protein product [Bursaphelenchus xylophilus]|uniref:(pine wood nematode) hypothetical protein n=1 Tax=Bursaphelenchus xylophilus TaxID=6326 RepID=A0A1I7S675_BURXY|nr:unnamed protein product [Bursaphelenchus xylophilus]CAG9081079.1 unnamed protein product [Bursaphelenchus xylophilus]